MKNLLILFFVCVAFVANTQDLDLGAGKDTIEIEPTLIAKSGIKLGELSYFPSSNDDLQAEAITAPVGTKWRKSFGGQFYEIHKTESNRVVRVLISEGESGGVSILPLLSYNEIKAKNAAGELEAGFIFMYDANSNGTYDTSERPHVFYYTSDGQAYLLSITGTPTSWGGF